MSDKDTHPLSVVADGDRNSMMTAALANVSGALIDAGATWTDDPTDYGGKIRHEIEFRDLRIQLLEFELAICERAATGVLGKNDKIWPALGFTRAFAAIIELRDRLDAYLYADGQVDERGKPINAAHHPDPFEVPPQPPVEKWWLDLPRDQWCPKCHDCKAPCCNPQCDGDWGTGCFHCHYPTYGEHPSFYKAPEETT